MLVIMLLLFGVITFVLEYFVYDYFGWEQWLFLLVPIACVTLFYTRGRQIFEYDSDGEALNFKNRNVMLFLDKNLSDEFPKYKLLKFEMINIIVLKRLYVTVSSKKGHGIILRYDISYLNKKEINDLRLSLGKVIKNNKEQKREQNS